VSELRPALASVATSYVEAPICFRGDLSVLDDPNLLNRFGIMYLNHEYSCFVQAPPFPGEETAAKAYTTRGLKIVPFEQGKVVSNPPRERDGHAGPYQS
jgi:hypothetical protein